MARPKFYDPKPVGAEAKVRERLEAWGKVRKDGK
jgi:putative ATPase